MPRVCELRQRVYMCDFLFIVECVSYCYCETIFFRLGVGKILTTFLTRRLKDWLCAKPS
jgi:hypothetical protein